MPSSSLFLRSCTTLISVLSLLPSTLAAPQAHVARQAQTATYSIAKEYSGSSFFDQFYFFPYADPTHGYVTYGDKDYAETNSLISYDGTYNYMYVDSSTTLRTTTGYANNNNIGRKSVRLEGTYDFTHGLIITDIAHMPSGICGTWPAFWTLGRATWPTGGEIDIIEGANNQAGNWQSLHTQADSSISRPGSMAGSITSTDCAVHLDQANPNYTGCKITDPDSSTFGSYTGGVWATQWTSQGIKVWYWPYNSVPSDVTTANPNPNSPSWGQPRAWFGPSSSLNADNAFKAHHIIFDTTFCGDLGDATWGSINQAGTCASKTRTASCAEYVAKNPSVFKDAYWKVKYVKIFQNDGTTTTSSSSTSSKTTTSSSKTTTSSSATTTSSSLTTSSSSKSSSSSTVSSTSSSTSSKTSSSSSVTTTSSSLTTSSSSKTTSSSSVSSSTTSSSSKTTSSSSVTTSSSSKTTSSSSVSSTTSSSSSKTTSSSSLTTSSSSKTTSSSSVSSSTTSSSSKTTSSSSVTTSSSSKTTSSSSSFTTSSSSKTTSSSSVTTSSSSKTTSSSSSFTTSSSSKTTSSSSSFTTSSSSKTTSSSSVSSSSSSTSSKTTSSSSFTTSSSSKTTSGSVSSTTSSSSFKTTSSSSVTTSSSSKTTSSSFKTTSSSFSFSTTSKSSTSSSSSVTTSGSSSTTKNTSSSSSSSTTSRDRSLPTTTSSSTTGRDRPGPGPSSTTSTTKYGQPNSPTDWSAINKPTTTPVAGGFYDDKGHHDGPKGPKDDDKEWITKTVTDTITVPCDEAPGYTTTTIVHFTKAPAHPDPASTWIPWQHKAPAGKDGEWKTKTVTDVFTVPCSTVESGYTTTKVVYLTKEPAHPDAASTWMNVPKPADPTATWAPVSVDNGKPAADKTWADAGKPAADTTWANAPKATNTWAATPVDNGKGKPVDPASTWAAANVDPSKAAADTTWAEAVKPTTTATWAGASIDGGKPVDPASTSSWANIPVVSVTVQPQAPAASSAWASAAVPVADTSAKAPAASATAWNNSPVKAFQGAASSTIVNVNAVIAIAAAGMLMMW